MADPTAWEWTAGGAAAGLVSVLLAVLGLRPVLGRSRATGWARTAGLLLATLATGLVLVVVVAAVAAGRTGPEATGVLAGGLVPSDEPTAGRIAAYSGAVLLPLAAVAGVLAVAVVDLGRGSGLRIAAGVLCGLVVVTGAAVVLGDAGAAPTGAAAAAGLLAAAAGLALLLDEVAGGRRR